MDSTAAGSAALLTVAMVVLCLILAVALWWYRSTTCSRPLTVLIFVSWWPSYLSTTAYCHVHRCWQVPRVRVRPTAPLRHRRGRRNCNQIILIPDPLTILRPALTTARVMRRWCYHGRHLLLCLPTLQTDTQHRHRWCTGLRGC